MRQVFALLLVAAVIGSVIANVKEKRRPLRHMKGGKFNLENARKGKLLDAVERKVPGVMEAAEAKRRKYMQSKPLRPDSLQTDALSRKVMAPGLSQKDKVRNLMDKGADFMNHETFGKSIRKFQNRLRRPKTSK